MSEDRLERALQQMKEEDVDARTLEAARARVWGNMTNTGNATCAEFRPDLRAYLANELGGGRRILVEDHLGRCAACRARIAASGWERVGERHAIGRQASRTRQAVGHPSTRAATVCVTCTRGVAFTAPETPVPSVIAITRAGRLAAIAVRTIAG